MLSHFRRVPVREKTIRAKILVHLDEMRFALRFFARAAHARLAIADDPARPIDPARFHERPQAQESRTSDSNPDWQPAALRQAHRA